MKRLSLSLLTLTIFCSTIGAVRLDNCSLGFKTKHFFNPVKKMSNKEKNKELIEYAQSSIKKCNDLLMSLAWRAPKFFNPSDEYVSEILYLIQHGANPNISVSYTHNTGKSTFKPIYLFIANNDIKGTRLLLEKGACVNKPIIGNTHPLVFAYTEEMANLLLEYSAIIQDTHKEVNSWRNGTVKRNIVELISLPEYSPELIPFYLNQLDEEERKEKAQIILNLLILPEGLRDAMYHQTDAYKQKRNYLVQFGAQEKLVPDKPSALNGDWTLSDSKSR